MANRSKRTPTSGALTDPTDGSSIPAFWAARPKELAELINRDRLIRRLTWPAFAEFLGVPHSTVYKIAGGRTNRPHELTVAQILERIKAVPATTPAAPSAGGTGATTTKRKRR